MDREIKTILLVDSSASILFYLGMLLKRLEYKVETARTGEEAFQKMEEKQPSIVLTEIALAGSMDGITLLKRIRQSPLLKAIPVVVLTSENNPEKRDACKGLGCSAYLFKPVEPEDLYQALQSVSESIPRANIRLSTSLKTIIGDGTTMGGKVRIEYALAISEGGIYVSTLYPQPQNALTPVRVFLPDREITAKAVVLYSYTGPSGPYKEPGMGMKFLEISDADRAAIRSFIKERLTGDIAPKE